MLTPAILGIQTQLWWRPHLPGFFRCNEKLSTGSVETVTLDIPKKKGHHWHHIHVIWNCIEYHRMTSSRLIPTSTNDQIWKIMENPWIGWESWGNQQGFPCRSSPTGLPGRRALGLSGPEVARKLPGKGLGFSESPGCHKIPGIYGWFMDLHLFITQNPMR